MHGTQPDDQRGLQNVEGGVAGSALNLIVDKCQYLQGGHLWQQFAQRGGDFRVAVQRIVILIGTKQRTPRGHENLQRGLLAQGGKPIHTPLVAKQLVHGRRCGADSGLFERLLYGGQDKLPDDIQQNVVAGELKSFTEQQTRIDFDVVAYAIIQPVLSNRQIGSAATDID
ncbi:hypothetical protein D3C73_1182000 [compost metagenome]